jgi:hypothetical protein
MTINAINAAFGLNVSNYPTATGLSGGIPVSINQDLRYLNLNSAYVNVFANSSLISTTNTFNNFPAVNFNGAAAQGEDKQPLLLNSIHAIVLQCIKVDDTLPATGSITATFTKLGSSAVATRSFVVGDSLMLTTTLGWPAVGTTALAFTGTASLTNTQLIVALVGHTSATGTGYSA